MSVETINQVLAVVTVAGHFFLVIGILSLCFKKSRDFLIAMVGRNGIFFAFGVAVASTAFSLFYSEIAGFVPCTLCWFQRIFMYPQIVLLGIALFKKDSKIVDYALPLTVIGTIFSLYHNYVYYGGVSILPCSAFGLGVSCLRRYVFELGYITIPLMSLTSFLLLIFFLSIQKIYNRQKMR